MSAPLPPGEMARLSKFLALLDSDQAGERDAAVAAATRLLERHGVRWSQVLDPAPSVVVQTRPTRTDWRITVAELLRRPGSLRPWEAGFLESLEGFARLSAKQHAVLDLIAERVLRTAAAA